MTNAPNKPSPPPLPEPRIVAAERIEYKHKAAHLKRYSRVVRTPQGIVIHCTHGVEGLHAAEDGAAECARDPLPGQAKVAPHMFVDANSVSRCIADEFTAWHCGRHGNAYGIGVELCGRADQTRAQWFDATSLATLNIAARVCAELCRQHDIPAVVVNARGLLAGERGITTHAFVSEAWKESTHWDPGPGFPLGAFVAAVAAALRPPSSPSTTTPQRA